MARRMEQIRAQQAANKASASRITGASSSSSAASTPGSLVGAIGSMGAQLDSPSASDDGSPSVNDEKREAATLQRLQACVCFCL